MKYDYLVVGAGFFGSSFARSAADNNQSCLVIDSKHHVAGAAYDIVQNGIPISQYGAHIFHTQSKQVWDFVQRFADWNSFINKPKALAGGRMYSFPPNLMTISQVYSGVNTPQEAVRCLNEVRDRSITKPRNAEEYMLMTLGRRLYDLFFYGYTKKQGHREPSTLPVSIVKRIALRLTYEENYFSTDFQGMPIGGYTNLINNMLDDVNIRVDLGTDYFSRSYESWLGTADRIVYSGPVEKLVQIGEHLEYNTMTFEHHTLQGDPQGNAVINFCDPSTVPLRGVQHSHFYNPTHLVKHGISSPTHNRKSVVTYDMPARFRDHPEPYYPIRDERNTRVYDLHRNAIKDCYPKLTLGGRVGEYKYLDMDQTIASAQAKYSALQRKENV